MDRYKTPGIFVLEVFIIIFIIEIKTLYALLLTNVGKVYLCNLVKTRTGINPDQWPPLLIVFADKGLKIEGDRVDNCQYLSIGEWLSLACHPLFIVPYC